MSGLTSFSEQFIRLLDVIKGPGRQPRIPRNIIPALMAAVIVAVILALVIELFGLSPGVGRYPGGHAFTNLVGRQFKYSGRYQSNHWFRNAGGQRGRQWGGQQSGLRGGQQGGLRGGQQGGLRGGQQGGLRGGQQGRQRGGRQGRRRRRWNDKYLQFVLQVPRTVNPRSTLNQRFTIHGLWPTSKYNTAITYCNTRNYAAADLRKMLRQTNLPYELLQSWPNVVTPNNLNAVWSFWRYQYNKHGSCAYWRFQTLEAYFRKADDLYRSDNVQHLYDSFTNNRQVSAIRYMNDIKNYGGKFPGLRCNGTGFLIEVIICYTKQATKMIDCPKRGELYEAN